MSTVEESQLETTADQTKPSPAVVQTAATRTGRLLQRVNSVKKPAKPPVQPKSPLDPNESAAVLVRKGRKGAVEGEKAVKKTRVGKRGEREVLLTSETIRDHEETVNSTTETKSRKFMKKLFAL